MLKTNELVVRLESRRADFSATAPLYIVAGSAMRPRGTQQLPRGLGKTSVNVLIFQGFRFPDRHENSTNFEFRSKQGDFWLNVLQRLEVAGVISGEKVESNRKWSKLEY